MAVRWEHLLEPVEPVKRKIGHGTWYTRDGDMVTVRLASDRRHRIVEVTPISKPSIRSCQDLADFFAALLQQYRDDATNRYCDSGCKKAY